MELIRTSTGSAIGHVVYKAEIRLHYLYRGKMVKPISGSINPQKFINLLGKNKPYDLNSATGISFFWTVFGIFGASGIPLTFKVP